MKNYNQSHTLITPTSGAFQEREDQSSAGLQLLLKIATKNHMLDNLKFFMKRVLNIKSYPSWLIFCGITAFGIVFCSFLSFLYWWVIC